MMRLVSMAVLTAVLSGGSAWAQEETSQFRTAVSVVGGLSVGSARSFDLPGRRGGFGGRGSDSAFAAGGGLAHDLSPRVTLEATGVYLDRGSSAWSADAGLRLNLTASRNSLVPYFAVSGGIYSERRPTTAVRAEPDVRGRDVRGRTPASFRPMGGVPRGEETVVRSGGSRESDGLLTLGGGVLFAAGPHVFVRPDVRAQMVFSTDTRVMGLFTLNFGYRF